MTSVTAWRPLERMAGLGGLILDWQSRQPSGEAPAAADDIAMLARDGSLPAWGGMQAQHHAMRDAIGISCRVWPPDEGRYVYTTARLRVIEAQECTLRLGSYVGYRAWLDGALVAEAAPGPTFDLDDNCCLLGLAAGEHTLLVELDRATWETVFHARLTLPNGNDLPAEAVLVADGTPEGTALRRVPPAFAFYNEQFNQPGTWDLGRAQAVRGEHGTDGQAGDARRDWHDGFRRQYEAMLDLPPQTLTGVEVIERAPWQGGWRERVLLHGGMTGPVPLEVLLPAGNGTPRAGLLCLHGHGAGKDDVVGATAQDPAQAARVAEANYTYALQFAQRGFVTFAPDLRAFGERRDAERRRPGRDHCDSNFMKAAMLGLTPLALDLADLRLVVDYALQRPEVAAPRFGCVGLSLGGRMTMYLAALDDRIQAAVVSGALNSLRERLTSYAGCGSQFLPGLFRAGDTPELFGLIAPRPLLLELGTQDGTSPEIYAAEVYRGVRLAYALAGAEERLDLDIFARGHRFSGRKAFPFLERRLAAEAR
ncbi:MAG: alpha/beta hydrolase family protein [Chloroflexota bacterium]